MNVEAGLAAGAALLADAAPGAALDVESDAGPDVEEPHEPEDVCMDPHDSECETATASQPDFDRDGDLDSDVDTVGENIEELDEDHDGGYDAEAAAPPKKASAAPPKKAAGKAPPKNAGKAPPKKAAAAPPPKKAAAKKAAAAPPPKKAAAKKAAGAAPPPKKAAGAAPPPKKAAGEAPPPKKAAGAAPPPKKAAGAAPPPKKAKGAAPPPKKAAGAAPSNGAAETALPKRAADSPAAGAPPAKKACGANTCRQLPELDSELVYCGTCNQEMEQTNCRLTSKIAGKWKCKTCFTTTTQLYRIFGKWPLDEFTFASAQDQAAFMAKAGTLGAKELLTEASKFLEKYERHETTYSEGGSFEPVSVWIQRGYDGATIVAHSKKEDTMEHPLFGTVYRVPIIATFKTGCKGQVKTNKFKPNMKMLGRAPTSIL